MNVRAGTKNKLIAIESRSPGKDAANQPLDVWVVAFTLWANISGETGRGAIRNSQEGVAISPNQYSFRVKYRKTGITTDMRVNWKGQIFEIRDIRHDHAGGNWTDIICETGITNG